MEAPGAAPGATGLPGTRSAPWIAADFTGICDGHWSRSTARMLEFLRGVAAEGLLHGMPKHCLSQAFDALVCELEAGRIGKVRMADLRPVLEMNEQERLLSAVAAASAPEPGSTQPQPGSPQPPTLQLVQAAAQ